MMVFFKERLAYLAMPKTGTSAVERALASRASAILRSPPGLKHTNAQGYERRFRAMFEHRNLDPVQTCAVVREPIDWLGSWFRYRQRPALTGTANSTLGMTFDAFVTAYLQQNRPPFADLGSQSRFVTDENGDLLINHLFQYEQLSEFHAFLERRLGQKIETKRVNTSPKAEMILSPEVEAQLRKDCAADFQIHEALSDGPLSVS